MRHAMLIVTAAALTFASHNTVGAEPTGQQPARLEKQVPVALDYLLYLPADYEQKENWPLLVFLHGAGERGDDLELVKKHGPPKLIEGGKQFPFIVVSPQCPTDQWWTTKPLELMALVDEVAAKHKVDSDRIYLTGLSMGGYGTWTLASYAPERFAAIAPVCGGGEPLTTRRLAKMPTWVFHGAKDPVVPLARSEAMVDALKRVNKDVQFTVYPDALHDSWTETYDNPQLYEWLLAQKRSSAGGPEK
ncbi:MAG: prolyl oligopeptidase family serine peptidase [Pirellulales bacterium]